MFKRPPTPQGPRQGPPVTDRRAAAGAPGGVAGPLARLKSLLVRPLGLVRSGIWVRLVLIDRRHPDLGSPAASLPQVRDELRARLIALAMDEGVLAMRELVRVHDTLGRKGWAGVEALPGQELAVAIDQATQLLHEDPSVPMATLVERLRQILIAIEVRNERRSRFQAQDRADRPEVSEATREEYDEMERRWEDTWPPELNRSDRERSGREK
jgi:hypothetical protein